MIEQKTVENRLWAKSEFLRAKRSFSLPSASLNVWRLEGLCPPAVECQMGHMVRQLPHAEHQQRTSLNIPDDRNRESRP